MPERKKTRPAPPLNPDRERKRRLQTLRGRLEIERTSWSRWMSRLKRAFHAVEKGLVRIGRLERDIGKLESN